MRVGIVCEGATDFPVLEKVLEALLPNEWEITLLKPEQDQLGRFEGFGWNKVRQWCTSMGRSLPILQRASLLHDLVIIQIDADIRSQVQAKSNLEFCETIKSWLGSGVDLSGVIIVIPTQAIETWLLAAHRASNPKIEGERHPANALVREGLLQMSDVGQPIKDVDRYRTLALALPGKLTSLRAVLPELQRFCEKVEAFVARHSASPTTTHSKIIDERDQGTPKSRSKKTRKK